ncbi:hypothetical protein [Streptomyces sp. Wh19]|uniref:hypothetical protein n=1 Tax=Streptomyces sp. Wh19 TaxID=3076629 RepID=UPI003FA3DA1A
MLVPRTVIDPATPGIRTAPIEDRPILRLLFAATRHTETANPTPTAIVAALRTAARQSRTPRLSRASWNASRHSGSDMLSVRYCSYAARLGGGSSHGASRRNG